MLTQSMADAACVETCRQYQAECREKNTTVRITADFCEGQAKAADDTGEPWLVYAWYNTACVVAIGASETSRYLELAEQCHAAIMSAKIN